MVVGVSRRAESPLPVLRGDFNPGGILINML